MFLQFVLAAIWLPGSLAAYTNYFPPPVEGVTVIASKQNKDITLSYKQTEICETSYSGYVHIPASALSDVEGPPEYDINMFYWFFPARQSPSTAPISIWIGGGPGEAAIAGAMTENGPCHVNEDGNSTVKNPFSRNNRVNMLYIDQPVGAGFSYSRLLNVTYDMVTSTATATDFSKGIPFTPNANMIPGTVSDPDFALTANNSNIAAKAMWHFAQTWFDTFPKVPQNKKISLWTNSYGGYFGPAIFRFWDSQNKLIESGKLQALPLPLDTLGIENGCIDAMSQGTSWIEILYNNTYGLQMINETDYNELMQSIYDSKTGCISLIEQCRQLAYVEDPEFYGNNQDVNLACGAAADQCFPLIQLSMTRANRNGFDMAQIGPEAFPGYQHVGFFNQPWVQRGLGVPVNFTDAANLTLLYFGGTGDPFRQNQSSIEYLLENNIQVALVYGDRDTRCNWIGAENVSLTVNYPDSNNFHSAGYADIQTNNSYKGGVVRQYDGFSFSRVFEAGHLVSAFQPETSYQIFDRVMFRHDIATGNVPAGFDTASYHYKRNGSPRSRSTSQNSSMSHYQSKGPSSSWSIKNVLPPSLEPVCNLWAAPITCAPNQIVAMTNGSFTSQDFWVTSPNPQL